MQTCAALAAVIATAALLATPARAESDFPPAISVTGQADISVAPDLARIDAGVATDGKTAREASDANNAAMGKVLLALKTLGLDQKDYQTSQLSLQPQYAPNRNASAPSPIVGYRASNRVTIKIRDITRVASVIDAVVAAGANDVGNIYFSVSQASKLLDDARTKALADARRKAEIYAKAAGVTLGAPLSISEGGVPVPLFHAKVAARFAAAAPVPVAPGEETLSVNVSASWAIKPGP
jgi:uncharacterized protein YggE